MTKSILRYNNSIIKPNSKIIRQNWSYGGGLKFDGVNDYVTFGNIFNSFNFNTPFSFTITLKLITFNALTYTYRPFNINSTGDSGIYLRSTTAYNFSLFLYTNASKYRAINGKLLTIDTLYTLTYVYNGDLSMVGSFAYTNGIKNTSFLIVGSPPTTFTSGQAMLCPNVNKYSNMYIFDLKVFNKALTDAECIELYIKQGQIIPSSAISNCVADWRFEDKSGTVLTDRSGSGFNGTLVNYAAGTTDLGATNSWVDYAGDPLTQY